ncbi:MAG TPA: type II secretion system F family protein, partial [Paracoccaceae bacterium]|nr:type II secretion system F family protein [Paracoccaceae bacterium]
MPSYDYLAIDAGGREKRGALSAASEQALRDQLRARQLLPVRISAASAHPAAGGAAARAAAKAASVRPGKALFAAKLRTKELTLFTRQLATLVSVSPLEESLRAIGGQAEKPHVAAIVANVHAGVVEGQRLGAALGREPRSFPPLYRAMVSAGEGSGAMTQILNRLADLMERQAEVRGKVITAVAYPLILAVFA